MRKPGAVSMSEVITRETYPDSGAQVLQLTSSPAVHSNIYCEVPYMDPASRYVVYQKAQASQGPWEIWRADLHTRRSQLLAEDTDETLGVAVSFDQRFFYCTRSRGEGHLDVIRMDMTSLVQRTTTFVDVPTELSSMAAVAPDGRSYYVSARLGRLAEHRFGILRLDLETGEHAVIHERGDDLCNAHVQMDPGSPQDLLIQHNRGAEYDDEGNMLKLVDEPWATLYMIDVNGGDFRQLPVGKPYTQPCQGHQCWIGSTSEVLVAIVWDSIQQACEEGCLLRVRPGDERASVVARGFPFVHPNASRDGRFFVSDVVSGTEIVVGSLRTGRCRVLCEARASLSGPQYTHPHPYLSPDSRWVVFNSDRTGIPHVYAARVPDGLLEGLE